MVENFLVLTFFDDYSEIDAIKADFIHKKINVVSQIKLPLDDTGEGESKFLENLKKIFLRAFYFKPYEVILVLDSKRALANYSTITLTREEPEAAIDDSDIENLISQAIWKTLEDGRKLSAKQFNLGDSDILLFDTRIYEIKIDGHKIINPVNHKGSKIDIYLNQTFVSRPFFVEVSALLPGRAKLAFVSEGGAAATHLLSKIETKRNFIFAKVMDNETHLFCMTPQNNRRISFFDYFSWGKNKFYSAVAKDLAIGPQVARQVLRKLSAGETSKFSRRYLRQAIAPEIITFLRGLNHAVQSTKSNLVYLDFSTLAPGELHNEKILSKMITPVKTTEILIFFGFHLNNLEDKEPDFLSLASLLEYYFLPRENLVNRLAKRRIRWLMPE